MSDSRAEERARRARMRWSDVTPCVVCKRKPIDLHGSTSFNRVKADYGVLDRAALHEASRQMLMAGLRGESGFQVAEEDALGAFVLLDDVPAFNVCLECASQFTLNQIIGAAIDVMTAARLKAEAEAEARS